MTITLRSAFVLTAAALMLSACGDSATEPAPQALVSEIPALSLELSQAEAGEARSEEWADRMPTLVRLFHHAVARIAERRGQAEAQQIVASVHESVTAAQQAAEAGNLPQFRRFIHEAHLKMSHAVILVFGPRVVAHVQQVSGNGLERLVSHIEKAKDAGHDVTRAERLARMVALLRADAARRMEARQPVQALISATRALDLLRFGLHHYGQRRD